MHGQEIRYRFTDFFLHFNVLLIKGGIINDQ